MNTKKMKEAQSRLVKYLSMSGFCSRRESARIIKDGKILVNGKLVKDPSVFIKISDKVECNGEKIRPGPDNIYLILNKPKGYVCSLKDSHAEKLASGLIDIPGSPRIFNVGRLDKDSEGLIMFTNDGNFMERVSHPRYGVRKTYEVLLDAPLQENDLNTIKTGIRDGNDTLRVAEIRPCETKNLYLFVMTEGKKREIRRIASRLGRKIMRLKRVSIGKLELGNLETGKWRFLSEEEIALCFKK